MTVTEYLTDKEKMFLQQNCTCTYCGSRNTYFVRHFSAVHRLTKCGEPFLYIKDGKKEVIDNGVKAQAFIKATLSQNNAVTLKLWLYCLNCGKNREVELMN